MSNTWLWLTPSQNVCPRRVEKPQESPSQTIFQTQCMLCEFPWPSVMCTSRYLDNFSNSLEQISCENKARWENWKFIISYQWPEPALSQAHHIQLGNWLGLAMTRSLTIARIFPWVCQRSDCWVGQFGLEDELWSCVIVLAGTKTRSYKIWTKSIYY